MAISRTLWLAAALFVGASIGCHSPKNNRTLTAQNGTEVGNGTDASGNGSTTPDPQQTQTPRCEPEPGAPPDPRCEDRSPTVPTTPDPHP